MVRLITLHGEMSGSARVNMTDRGTQLSLSLRGKRRDGMLTAYLVGAERVISMPISGSGIGSAAALDVRGVLLADSRGDFVAWGTCCGMTQEGLNRAKAQIRMMQPEARRDVKSRPLEDAPMRNVGRNAGSGVNGGNAGSGGAHSGGVSGSNAGSGNSGGSSRRAESALAAERRLSPVTEGILGKAKELFGNMPENSKGDAEVKRKSLEELKEAIPPCENCASNEEEAVINPFPTLFPNSYWKRRIGNDGRIIGVANVRGIHYNITALRSSSKRPPRGLRGNLRRIRARDGKMYWIGIVRK